MYCTWSCFFLLTLCLIATSFGNHQSNSQQRFESMLWNELLKKIEKVNKRGFSLTCQEVSNEDFCFPEQMLKAVKHGDAAIVHVLHPVAEFFKRAGTPLQNKNVFLRGMQEAHAQLKTCLKSRLNNIHESIVKDYLKRMETLVAMAASSTSF